jgi:hypothetical protein
MKYKEIKEMNIEKYIEALNNLLGSDCMYYQGDKDVESIIEIILTARDLAKDNEILNKELQIIRAYIHNNGLEWDLLSYKEK